MRSRLCLLWLRQILLPRQSRGSERTDSPRGVSMFNICVGRGTALPLAALAGVLGLANAVPAQQLQHYKQTNLVSDTTTDPNLVNGWGMSRSSGSPWWVSDNGTGKATLYTGTGTIAPLVVTIPPGDPKKNLAGTPTGQVFNG